MKIGNSKNNKGATMIITVAVILTAALIMAVSSVMSGLSEAEIGYLAIKTDYAQDIAESCADEALNQLRINSSFVANSLSLPMNEGSCILTITNNGSKRNIDVQGVLDKHQKKIMITANVDGSGNITIDSWKIF
jgi:hypothetical protein